MLWRLVCVLLFLAWTAEIPGDRILYSGHWRSAFEIFGPLFVSIPNVGLSTWQLLMAVLAPICVLQPAAYRNRARAMDAAILISLSSVALTFLWGFMRGSSAYSAYYQLWRFLFALLVALMLLSVVRNSRALKALGFTVLMAALVRGSLAIYFYWAVVHGKIEPKPPTMTTHDDSLLFIAGIVVMLAWAVARRKTSLWIGAAIGSLHLIYAMGLNGRRLAWIELLLVIVFGYALLPAGALRRRVTQFAIMTAPVILVYVAVGWGRSGPLFEPIRALSTSGSDGDASSLARLEEMKNLMYTLSLKGNPLFGTGWGVPYEKASSYYANFGDEWVLYRYLPHNSLLGVAAFGGLGGIFGMWLVVPVAAFLATRGYRQATRPVDRAAGLAAVCILPAYGVQCYGDIGFQSLTCGLILGVALAAAGKSAAFALLPSDPVRRTSIAVPSPAARPPMGLARPSFRRAPPDRQA
jgi:hypothetical protein